LSPAPSTPQANRLWAKLVIEELVRCGVGLFCVAPGSRSTPLVAALAENPRAKNLIHYDERGTAFAALGHARAAGLPAAWITTSGTAVANGLPAVVEASIDCVPMILLTADRPPELRRTGANQTIDQPGIFGGYVRWSFDLAAPDPTVDPASVLTTVDQAVYRARRSPGGPVHLNLMFREPFLPETVDEDLPVPDRWGASGKPYTGYAETEPAPDGARTKDLADALHGIERGLVVAGRLASRRQGEATLGLAEALGWPLLPDIGSQVRLGGSGGNTIPYYDALLAGEEFAEAHAPEAVLRIGGGAVSKRLEQFLTRAAPDPYIVVRENPFRLDPAHRVTDSIEAGITAFCAALAEAVFEERTSTWTAGWREASERTGRGMDGLLTGTGSLSEPLAARLLSRHVPAEHGLFLASSMPVRDADTFSVADRAPVPVGANRGASGIDGTVASAAGFARGLGRPVTLLIGDLALLHDLNSLSMLREVPVIVVTINNDGGGIFSFLPVSRQKSFFEPYFGTPHGLGFEHAAGMFGLPYEHPRTAVEFLRAYRTACSRRESAIIEVRTDREENVALHEELLRDSPGRGG
jgi:2-succinyl-5-enolpyruvyl-6-hydroxy-3-cyclohexene-1-carboxylate synthase